MYKNYNYMGQPFDVQAIMFAREHSTVCILVQSVLLILVGLCVMGLIGKILDQMGDSAPSNEAAEWRQRKSRVEQETMKRNKSKTFKAKDPNEAYNRSRGAISRDNKVAMA
jgi:hypothetical protein